MSRLLSNHGGKVTVGGVTLDVASWEIDMGDHLDKIEEWIRFCQGKASENPYISTGGPFLSGDIAALVAECRQLRSDVEELGRIAHDAAQDGPSDATLRHEEGRVRKACADEVRGLVHTSGIGVGQITALQIAAERIEAGGVVRSATPQERLAEEVQRMREELERLESPWPRATNQGLTLASHQIRNIGNMMVPGNTPAYFPPSWFQGLEDEADR